MVEEGHLMARHVLPLTKNEDSHSACVRLENPSENHDLGTLCISLEQTQGLGAFFAKGRSTP